MPSHRALFGAVVLAAAGSLPAQNPPPGFTYQTLVDGPLQSAVAMAFLPDGRLLIAERQTGDIRQFRNGALDPTPWAHVPADSGGVYTEAGLVGIAVDPGFLGNRYVYVYYREAGGGGNRIARLQEVGGVGTNLTVLTPAGALGVQLYHNGGTMVFGHDGKLYVAVGDALGAANAQSPTHWVGKVLRFAVPGLTVPLDNPFPGSPVYSLGHRNHFGLAVHPVTGVLYQTENGGNLMDELNRILPGANYGWPIHEGTEQPQDPAYQDPLAVFQPTMAPTGCCFYQGSHYPASYRNAWFFADYNENQLHVAWLSAGGAHVVGQAVFDDLPGTGYSVLSGPDGNLWFLTNDGGGYGADELGRYVHQNESMPSLQLSSVSNKTIAASLTVCVHAPNGSIAVAWMSLAQVATPLPTAFGNLWVMADAWLPTMLVTADDRAYLGLPVPNAPTFLGAPLHTQAIVFEPSGAALLTNPAQHVIRG